MSVLYSSNYSKAGKPREQEIDSLFLLLANSNGFVNAGELQNRFSEAGLQNRAKLFESQIEDIPSGKQLNKKEFKSLFDFQTRDGESLLIMYNYIIDQSIKRQINKELIQTLNNTHKMYLTEQDIETMVKFAVKSYDPETRKSVSLDDFRSLFKN